MPDKLGPTNTISNRPENGQKAALQDKMLPSDRLVTVRTTVAAACEHDVGFHIPVLTCSKLAITR